MSILEYELDSISLTLCGIRDGLYDDHSAAPRLKQLAEVIANGRKQLPLLLESLPYERHAKAIAVHEHNAGECVTEIKSILRGDVWTEEDDDYYS